MFSGCPYGDDDVWGITWPNTPGGTTNSQPCPGGVDSVGALYISSVLLPCISIEAEAIFFNYVQSHITTFLTNDTRELMHTIS